MLSECCLNRSFYSVVLPALALAFFAMHSFSYLLSYRYLINIRGLRVFVYIPIDNRILICTYQLSDIPSLFVLLNLQ